MAKNYSGGIEAGFLAQFSCLRVPKLIRMPAMKSLPSLQVYSLFLGETHSPFLGCFTLFLCEWGRGRKRSFACLRYRGCVGADTISVTRDSFGILLCSSPRLAGRHRRLAALPAFSIPPGFCFTGLEKKFARIRAQPCPEHFLPAWANGDHPVVTTVGVFMGAV